MRLAGVRTAALATTCVLSLVGATGCGLTLGIAEQLGGAATGVLGGDTAAYWRDRQAAHQRREQAQQASVVEADASTVKRASDAYADGVRAFVSDYNEFRGAVETFAQAQNTFRFNLSDRQVALYESSVEHQNRESLARFLRTLTAAQRTDLQALADTWLGLSERGAALAARARTLQAQATAVQMAQNEQALEAIELQSRWAAE